MTQPQECTSDSGVVVGLVDAMTAILNQLRTLDIPAMHQDEALQHALADFRSTLNRCPGVVADVANLIDLTTPDPDALAGSGS